MTPFAVTTSYAVGGTGASVSFALGMQPAVVRQILERGGALVGAGSALGRLAFLFLARIGSVGSRLVGGAAI